MKLVVLLLLFNPCYPYIMQQINMVTKDSQFCAAHYKDRVQHGLAGYVYSHNPFQVYQPQTALNCFLVLIAPLGYRIDIRTLRFTLSGSREGGSCEGDTLHILDYKESVPPSAKHPGFGEFSGSEMETQFCGRRKNSSVGVPLFVSTKNALSLWLHLASRPKNQTNPVVGFKLLWTAFRVPDITCKPKEFTCANGYCIPFELGCDSIPHCADGSDLRRDLKMDAGCPMPPLEEHKPLSDAVIACLAFGGAFILILAISVIAICCGRKYRNPNQPLDPSSTHPGVKIHNNTHYPAAIHNRNPLGSNKPFLNGAGPPPHGGGSSGSNNSATKPLTDSRNLNLSGNGLYHQSLTPDSSANGKPPMQTQQYIFV